MLILSPHVNNETNVNFLFAVHAWRIHDDSDQAGSAQDKLAIDVEESRFACFSVSVSYDGHYALAGANDGCIYLYDRHSDKLTLRVSGQKIWSNLHKLCS